MQGVWGGDGGGICGGTHDDSVWASGRGATELEYLKHRGRAADILHGFDGQGSPTELFGGGMPGPSGDKDGDASSLPIPVCPGYHGHSGGGKPPPPTVHLMGHSGPLLGTERQAPCHSSLRQGIESKEAAASGERSE